MRKYIVETADGDWKVWNATPFKEAIGLAPRVRKGFVTLEGKAYMVEPRKFRRVPYRPWRYLTFIKEYAQVQLWQEDVPEPVDLFSLGDGDEKDTLRTGANIARVMNETWIEKALRRPGMDMMTLLFFFSLICNAVLGFAIFSLVGA